MMASYLWVRSFLVAAPIMLPSTMRGMMRRAWSTASTLSCSVSRVTRSWYEHHVEREQTREENRPLSSRSYVSWFVCRSNSVLRDPRFFSNVFWLRQELKVSQCPSVCLSVRHNMHKTSLMQSIFIFVGKRAIRQSESTQSIKIRFIQSEPLNTKYFALFLQTEHLEWGWGRPQAGPRWAPPASARPCWPSWAPDSDPSHSSQPD